MLEGALRAPIPEFLVPNMAVQGVPQSAGALTVPARSGSFQARRLRSIAAGDRGARQLRLSPVA